MRASVLDEIGCCDLRLPFPEPLRRPVYCGVCHVAYARFARAHEGEHDYQHDYEREYEHGRDNEAEMDAEARYSDEVSRWCTKCAEAWEVWEAEGAGAEQLEVDEEEDEKAEAEEEGADAPVADAGGWRDGPLPDLEELFLLSGRFSRRFAFALSDCGDSEPALLAAG